MRYFKSLFFCLFISGITNAQQAPQAIADSLQKILDFAVPNNISGNGAVLGIVVPGQWSWYSSSGNAIDGMTAGQPQTTATDSTLFRVGSITKTMLATCILKLEQDGLLSIEDPISLHLRSSLVNDTLLSSDTVLIRHLLNHTSGIANSGDNTGCSQNVLLNPRNSHSLEEAIWCGASLGEVAPPGTGWHYSNTNYSLLAMIIEQASGMSYRDYLYQTVINPLNLTHTQIPTYDSITAPHMGCYWYINGFGWVDLTIIDPSTYMGWADVVSNTKDLMIFHQALRSESIINATQLAKMHIIDAAANGYGLGLDFYTITTKDYIGHYGEVGNTSGMFFGGINSAIAPNGYYIAYNFNTQGVAMQNRIDVPILLLLNSSFATAIDNTVSKEIKVFPNPSSGIFNISISENSKFSSIQVFDLTGRLLKNIENAIDTNLDLNLSHFEKGLYILKIRSAEIEFVQKIVIQ